MNLHLFYIIKLCDNYKINNDIKQILWTKIKDENVNIIRFKWLLYIKKVFIDPLKIFLDIKNTFTILNSNHINLLIYINKYISFKLMKNDIIDWWEYALMKLKLKIIIAENFRRRDNLYLLLDKRTYYNFKKVLNTIDNLLIKIKLIKN